MNRGLFKTARAVLPLATGIAAASVRIVEGGPADLATVLLFCGGFLLGWAAALLLEGVALLVGHRTQDRSPPELEQTRLEREKGLLLRAIKDIEFEAALQRLPPGEAEQLAAPLRRQAVEVLRDLDRARQGQQPPAVEQQIELEVARRAAGEGSR
jgi:hypothetical protein